LAMEPSMNGERMSQSQQELKRKSSRIWCGVQPSFAKATEGERCRCMMMGDGHMVLGAGYWKAGGWFLFTFFFLLPLRH
jgi:hypothetical protein